MSSPASLSIHEPLRFHPLTFVDEGVSVVVGRPDIESYAALPADGAAVLKRMVDGAPPAEAAAWYERAYGESLDVDDLLESVDELGFLAAAGEEPALTPEPVGLQRLGRVLFSAPVCIACAALIGLWALVLGLHPDLVPRSRFVFFTHSLILVQCMVLFGQFPWLFLHEGGHVLAGRRLGLRTQLGFGTRLYFVVCESRIPSLLSVTRRHRYLVFMAGMLVDLVAVAALGVTAFALRDAGTIGHVVAAVALAMQFPICVRFAFQFILFLQTDVYYVIATALGCHDLHAAVKTVVGNRLWRAVRRPGRVRPVEVWSDRDLRVARLYAPLFAVGVSVLFVVWAVALVPLLLDICHMAATGLTYRLGSPRFWDATVFIVCNLGQILFFVYLSMRNRTGLRVRARSTLPSLEEGASA
jgi:hypothetical protein